MSADILAPIVRILLRWLGGILVARGWTADASTFADPELVQVACYGLAAACAALSEGWYWLARRYGWSK